MADNAAPRIAVISAVASAIGPAAAAIDASLPGAELWNILDDRLLSDARAHGIGSEERERMDRLIEHAIKGGADGVLVTCSLYAGVVRTISTHTDVPVLSADDAAFTEIAESGLHSIVLVAPLAEALADSTARLRAALPPASVMTIDGAVATDAHFAAAESNDALARVILRAIRPRLADVQAIFLAQYSLAPAADAVARATGLPVITTPGSAGRRLAELVHGEQVPA